MNTKKRGKGNGFLDRLKGWQKGGIIGLTVGILSIFLFEVKGVKLIFLYPLMILNKFIFHIQSEGAGPFIILINIILWSLIGLLISFIIYLIKRK